MGVDYHAIAAIGLRVRLDQVTKKVRKKTFQHDYPSDWIVDPVSKRELWHEYETLEEVAPYKFVDSTEGDEFVVIALRQVTTGSSRGGDNACRRPLDFTPHDIEMFKQEMVKRELWQESDFGLWAVQYVSF